LTLLNTTKSASVRMQEVFDLALEKGSVESDPRASEMGNADCFLCWPGNALGFVPDNEWDERFQGELAKL